MPQQTPASRRRGPKLIVTIGAAGALIAIVFAFAVGAVGGPTKAIPAAPGHGPFTLPTRPDSYLGLYAAGVPQSSAGVTAFTTATGIKPSVIPYYSGWFEPFQAGFAKSVARDGAVPLVQINPTGISLDAIASGRYDNYLQAYAQAIRAYRHPVILSFGHEMNGDWYSWGYKNTSPAVFVAAWRHIVTLFRHQAVDNVTWLWTVNIIDDPHYGRIPSPAQWWPGGSYVTWVGVDGYYYHSSSMFTSLFGPTIAAVREITRDPILIAETAAVPAAGQPAKIADLFAGVRLYALLGFVWFDTIESDDWQVTSPKAFAAFRRGAKQGYQGPSI
jgi:mannan endo-1,4-beta-mannosidase